MKSFAGAQTGHPQGIRVTSWAGNLGKTYIYREEPRENMQKTYLFWGVLAPWEAPWEKLYHAKTHGTTPLQGSRLAMRLMVAMLSMTVPSAELMVELQLSRANASST